jgi:hypothetical protein
MPTKNIEPIYFYSFQEDTSKKWVTTNDKLQLVLEETTKPKKFSLLYASGDPDYGFYYYIFSHSTNAFLITNGMNSPITATGIGSSMMSFQPNSFDGRTVSMWSADTIPLIWKIQDNYIIGGDNSYDANFDIISSTSPYN